MVKNIYFGIYSRMRKGQKKVSAVGSNINDVCVDLDVNIKVKVYMYSLRTLRGI